MSNYVTGHDAERQAAYYLENQGYTIIVMNWRTRRCEIDVIAKKKGVIYFVEVKYRRNELQGRGLEYVTPKKLSQMRYAAELWVADADWRGQYQLAAIEMSGEPPKVTTLVLDIV